VRWEHPENRGFLRALAGMQRAAAAIGEIDEADRCEQLLQQLEPAWARIAAEATPSPGAP
jgi:hypothetical protein